MYENYYLGTYEGYPTTPATTTTKKGAFDWLNVILSGANNILGQLFPYGLNNQGQVINTGQYYPTSTGGGNNNNTLLYMLVGFAVLYFLLKDSKK